MVLIPVQTVQHVACNIIQHCCTQHVAPFEHPVARCCMMLHEVWLGSNFQCNIVQHFYCSRDQWSVSQHVASVWTALTTMLHSRIHTDYWIEWYPWRWGRVGTIRNPRRAGLFTSVEDCQLCKLQQRPVYKDLWLRGASYKLTHAFCSRFYLFFELTKF